jgi:hypothetical protein
MDDITFGGLQEALLRPQVVVHMVAFDSQIYIVLWYPEERKYDILVILVYRWENKHKSSDICGRR